MDPSSITRSLMGESEYSDPIDEQLALSALEQTLFPERSPAPVLDRYVLLHKIGSGGQGVVFCAYDPDLDRRVALKLIRFPKGEVGPDSAALLAEARILAQISHPNVVTVYDVGTYARGQLGLTAGHPSELGIPLEGVFLVTELLDESLHEVMRRHPSPSEVLPMLMAAGRGIAAAHERGIVHRDFKPSNVLVSAAGEACVSDFGLACAASAADSVSTRVGTPAYMAPEQLRGEPADAKSDQYAFALTCHRALGGTALISAGESVKAARGRKGAGLVSPRVQAALARALSADPDARFPDMPALLSALEAGQRPRRLSVGIGAAALLGVAAVPVLVERGPGPCEQAGSAIAEVYNEDVRADLNEAFIATGAPYATGSWRSVQSALDEYADSWRRASRTACEDTHVRHVQSAAVLDERTECLRRLLLELADATEVMRTVDPVLLRNAVQLVHGLVDIESCTDPRTDASRRRMPSDRKLRAAVRDVYSELSRARLLELSGRYAEAMELARNAAQLAGDLPASELGAAAHLRLGSIAASRGRFEQARDRLLEGIQQAEAADDHAQALDGWTQLIWVSGVELQEPQAVTWAGFARAALERWGPDPMREAELVHNLGGLEYRRGNFGTALSHYQQALSAQQQLLSADDPRVGRTLNHIANALIELDEPSRALAFALRSLQIRSSALGDTHPLVAASLNNCASAHLRLKNFDAARGSVDRALEITRGSGLPEETVARRLSAWIVRERKGARVAPP